MYTIKVLKNSDSGKSSFCKVVKRCGPFLSEVGVGYLYLEEGQDLPDVGASFPYDGTVSFVDMVDTDTGELRQTKSGAVLQRIALG